MAKGPDLGLRVWDRRFSLQVSYFGVFVGWDEKKRLGCRFWN
jgi:hypothetical protein